MQPSSHGKCNDTLNEVPYSNKATCLVGTVSLILKDRHTSKTKKRDAEGEMIIVTESCAAYDVLRIQENPDRAIGFVLGKVDTVKALGMTEPNPGTVLVSWDSSS